MQRLSFPYSTRWIHIYTRNSGSQVKEKLIHIEKYDSVINKSSGELKQLKTKKQIKYKKLHKNAYPRYQALDVIKKNYPEFDNGNKMIHIGPTTNDDLKILSKTKDKRLIYSILGVTGEQLRDSKLITNDVNKFLGRGQLEKALYLVKLSKGNSGSGMDSLIRYYLVTLKSPKQAMSLYLWRRKNNISFTKFSYTIFFDGLAKQPELLSKSMGKSLFNIVERLIKEREQDGLESQGISLIEFNAILNGLANCEDPSFALQLFKKLNDRIPALKNCRSAKYDPITLSYLFKAISHINDKLMFISAFNNAINSLNGVKIDSKLCFQIARTLGSYQSDKNIMCGSLSAIEKYFDIYSISEETSDSSQIQLPEVSSFKKGLDRFQINEYVAGYYIQKCYDLKYYSRGIKFIESFLLQKHPDLMDMANVHLYMRFNILQYPTTCVSRCIPLFEKYLVKDNVVNKHGLILVYNAFLKESKKQFIIGDEIQLENLLTQLNKCILKWDSHSCNHKGKDKSIQLYNKDSWKFIVRIFSNINENKGKMSLYQQYKFITEYLKSLLYDLTFQLNDLSGKQNLETEKFIELGMIKVINQVIESNKLPDYNEVQGSRENQSQFHLRRHLLRLKNKLIVRIEYIETQLNWESSKIDLKLLTNELNPMITLAINDMNKECVKQQKLVNNIV
ncbi:MIOREX complex component 1 [Monosporozyma unispora]|nr:hypothetical protein C6P44_004531 [Kazachstania unispora]